MVRVLMEHPEGQIQFRGLDRTSHQFDQSSDPPGLLWRHFTRRDGTQESPAAFATSTAPDLAGSSNVAVEGCATEGPINASKPSFAAGTGTERASAATASTVPRISDRPNARKSSARSRAAPRANGSISRLGFRTQSGRWPSGHRLPVGEPRSGRLLRSCPARHSLASTGVRSIHPCPSEC